MPGIDEKLTFYPLNIAVLTVSDTRDEDTDKSGPYLIKRLTEHGHKLAGQGIVKDEVEDIRRQLKTWIDDPEVDVVITTSTSGSSIQVFNWRRMSSTSSLTMPWPASL